MNPSWKRGTIAVAGASSLLLFAVALSQERSPEDVIKGRQSNLHDLGSAYKELRDLLTKKAPSLFLIQQYIGQIGALAKERGYWFPEGTGPEAGIDTKAKALIWKTPDDFSMRMQTFATEVDKLVAAGATGDVALITSQHRALGEACKACHDKYRERED
jgi:cytochrome c556